MQRRLWDWDVPERRLLAVLALILALGLARVSIRGETAPAIDPVLVVDANTAPPEVLLALPRLGPVLVGRIVAERDLRPFDSLSDLDARVRGVGPATVAAIGPFLRFEPESLAAAGALASHVRHHAP
jgi:DNA uptake protein ComE-like DNA-binding protein